MAVLYQLSRCLAFRRIKHPELRWFTFYIPAAVTVVGTVVFFLLPIEPQLAGQGSLTRHLITFISILPGFFIAALAAIATFDRPNLDETMPDPAPTLKLRTRGYDEEVELTLRMFLTHLFAYLTALAFLTAIICILADLVAPSIVVLVEQAQPYAIYLQLTVKGIYVAIMLWLVSNIVFTGLFGLYFLAERMHRPYA